jgi:hypothetical protein
VYTRTVPGGVPLYGQEQCNYCGAAAASMTRNGYPNAADRVFYTQTTAWNMIQARNSTLAADANWATDPHGLTATLQDMNNPAGVHWVEFVDSSRDIVLFDMLYWMNLRQYPSPVLINQGGHWVVVTGWTTDIEPVGGSSPTLQSIMVNDPEPHNIGTATSFTGSQWFNGPWNGAVKYSGTWLGKYVAVVEPPIERGRVIVDRAGRTGARLISPARAVEAARAALANLDREANPQHATLVDRAQALDPLLVREESPTRRSKAPPQYYIVPFGLPDERHERGAGAVRGSVLVNAYTGALEEITSFGAPIRYLTQGEALEIAGSAIGDPARLKGAEATLMFAAGDITHIRAYPFWRVRAGRRTLYIDQLGRIYGKFFEAVPGD